MRGTARRLNSVDCTIGFGTVCMVHQSASKRAAITKATGTTPTTIGHFEIDVMLGYSEDTPGCFLFRLENGEFQPREALTVVQSEPFGFKELIVL